MEDFVREIEKGASLFLLYGDEGVGKSRLLSKLKDERLNDKTVHFIDFESDLQADSSQQVKDIAANAAEANVIIFDHFDSAPNKSQQQIFDSWSTDGRDKNLNMIVCASSPGFKRLRQLAQQFQLEAMSFQLLPCEQEESEAYLQHLLYPDQPFATLVLPVPVKRLLRRSKGLFSGLREIADHHSDLIGIKHEDETTSRLLPVSIIFSLFIGIVVAGYFLYLSQSSTVVESADLPIHKESTDAMPEPFSKPEPEPELKPETEPVPRLETKLASVADAEAEAESEPEVVPEPIIETEPVIDTPSDIVQDDKMPEPEPNGFEQRLANSRDWILNSDINRGTIQIMSIGMDHFNADNFQAYLDGLQQQGLDISQLRLFETRAGEVAVYSLIYGDFADRHEATRQIGLLPNILGAAEPISRSAGSIAREIARQNDN